MQCKRILIVNNDVIILLLCQNIQKLTRKVKPIGKRGWEVKTMLKRPEIGKKKLYTKV